MLFDELVLKEKYHENIKLIPQTQAKCDRCGAPLVFKLFEHNNGEKIIIDEIDLVCPICHTQKVTRN